MFELHYNIEGDTVFSRRFQRFGEDVKDMSPLWGLLATDFFTVNEREQFATQGAYGSGRWEPLSEPYRSWKAQKFPGAGILVRTGALKASLTRQGAPGNVLRITPEYVEMGTDIPYAGYHQHGTDKMTDRPPLALPQRSRTSWSRITAEWLLKRLPS